MLTEPALVEFRDADKNLLGTAAADRPGWNLIPVPITLRMIAPGPDLPGQLQAVHAGQLVGLFRVHGGAVENRIVPAGEVEALLAEEGMVNVVPTATMIAAATAYLDGASYVEILDGKVECR